MRGNRVRVILFERRGKAGGLPQVAVAIIRPNQMKHDFFRQLRIADLLDQLGKLRHGRAVISAVIIGQPHAQQGAGLLLRAGIAFADFVEDLFRLAEFA